MGRIKPLPCTKHPSNNLWSLRGSCLTLMTSGSLKFPLMVRSPSLRVERFGEARVERTSLTQEQTNLPLRRSLPRPESL